MQAEPLSLIVRELRVATAAVRRAAAQLAQACDAPADPAHDGADPQPLDGDIAQALASADDTSDDIAAIVRVIDDLTLQTDALLVEAAIEAALAAEQGGDFAQVAAEVRGLVERSAAATHEMRSLLDGGASSAREPPA